MDMSVSNTINQSVNQSIGNSINQVVRDYMQQKNAAIDAPEHWQDPKRYGWLLSPGLPFLAASIVALLPNQSKHRSRLKRGVLSTLCFAGPILIHGVIPALDLLIGEDDANPPDAAMSRLKDDPFYKRIVYAYVPLQYATLFFGAYKYVKSDFSPLAKLGLAISTGAISGVAINTAHELGHKKSGLENWLAKAALATSGYGHFVVEHNYGHHKNVSTPLDPASSQFNESFWQFLPRTVIGSFRSALGIEKARLARRDKAFFSADNEILQAGAISVGLIALLTAAFGKKALPFALIQGVYGFSLLEVVNYIEHYGLLRQKRANGTYERVRPEHSWNSNHVVTNLFLYQLQRHSDHHAHPTREYQLLRHFIDTPQLPSGYASMITLAYFPRLWFGVMNPKVIAHYGGDMSRINHHNPNLKPVREAVGALAGRVAGFGLSGLGKLLARV